MSDARNILLPLLFRPHVLGIVQTVVVSIVHEEIARKITVVIRSRIRSIVPVKCSITVLAEAVKHCSRSLQLLGLRSDSG